MPWVFKPQQRSVKIVPGETALSFYTAYNPTDKPITGVSTYNISPMRAGLYFNKIQCFCFEEQRLRPHEEIDMPVFFYVDPEFLKDPAMDGVKSLTLSYTFFRTGEHEVLDISDEIRQKTSAGIIHGPAGATAPVPSGAGSLAANTPADINSHGPNAERIRKWTEEVAKKTGLAQKLPAGSAAAAVSAVAGPVPTAAPTPTT